MRDQRLFSISALTDPKNLGRVYKMVGPTETRRLFACVRKSDHAPMVVLMLENGDGHPPYITSTDAWRRDEFQFTGKRIRIILE